MHPEQVIKSFIEENGIKLTHVAEKTNIHKDLLSKSLNGKRGIKAHEFIKLCTLLKLDIKDFESVVPPQRPP